MVCINILITSSITSFYFCCFFPLKNRIYYVVFLKTRCTNSKGWCCIFEGGYENLVCYVKSWSLLNLKKIIRNKRTFE